LGNKQLKYEMQKGKAIKKLFESIIALLILFPLAIPQVARVFFFWQFLGNLAFVL